MTQPEASSARELREACKTHGFFTSKQEVQTSRSWAVTTSMSPLLQKNSYNIILCCSQKSWHWQKARGGNIWGEQEVLCLTVREENGNCSRECEAVQARYKDSNWSQASRRATISYLSYLRFNQGFVIISEYACNLMQGLHSNAGRVAKPVGLFCNGYWDAAFVTLRLVPVIITDWACRMRLLTLKTLELETQKKGIQLQFCLAPACFCHYMLLALILLQTIPPKASLIQALVQHPDMMPLSVEPWLLTADA